MRTVNWLFNPGGTRCSLLVSFPSPAAPFNQHLAPCFTNSLLPTLRKRKEATDVIYYEIETAGTPGVGPFSITAQQPFAVTLIQDYIVLEYI
jgi:hypothetical protein